MSKGIRAVMVGGMVVVSVVGSAAIGAAQTSSASPTPMDSTPDAQTLRARAAAFWAARVAGDYETQWQLLEPRGRGRITAQEYGAEQGSIRYLAHQVEDATVNGFFGTVKVRILFQPILPSVPSRAPPQVVVADDGWIRISGVWYRRLEEGAGGPSPVRQP